MVETDIFTYFGLVHLQSTLWLYLSITPYLLIFRGVSQTCTKTYLASMEIRIQIQKYVFGPHENSQYCVLDLEESPVWTCNWHLCINNPYHQSKRNISRVLLISSRAKYVFFVVDYLPKENVCLKMKESKIAWTVRYPSTR